MTYKEKLAIEHPENISDSAIGGAYSCPYLYDYEKYENRPCAGTDSDCTKCWNREIPEEDSLETREERFNDMVKNEEIAQVIITSQSVVFDSDNKKDFDLAEHMDKLGNAIIRGFSDGITNIKGEQRIILDSGERRQFETGAVRDIQEGKGRCDLMPLDVIATIYHHHKEDCHESWIFWHLDKFKHDGEIKHLLGALDMFRPYDTVMTMFLEVAKHFEEGAKKYGEDNWQKGIPTKHYIDSAIRHYLKYLRGDQDEPHDRAFVWNIMCCIWTCKNKPELNSYRRVEED